MKNKKFKKFVKDYDLSKVDKGLLMQAFTHSSVGKQNNERLEFLGDAILDSVLSEYLYIALPKAQENYLTRLRAHLVNKKALAKLANELELYDYLILGSGEKQTGGHKRDSNLADAFEALLGAVFLELGYKKTKKLILSIYADELDHLPTEKSLKDSKTLLQEWLQKKGIDLPSYKILSEEGKPHNRVFVVEGKASNLKLSASGKSRKQAEQIVAENLLERLKINSEKEKNKEKTKKK